MLPMLRVGSAYCDLPFICLCQRNEQDRPLVMREREGELAVVITPLLASQEKPV